jgi:hypothetical protein
MLQLHLFLKCMLLIDSILSVTCEFGVMILFRNSAEFKFNYGKVSVKIRFKGKLVKNAL